MTEVFPDIERRSASIRTLFDWLLASALPLWAEKGVDYERGGFYERLDRDLTPCNDPRRARLVARQIYCFAMGAELGWEGPAAKIVAHGLDFLFGHMLHDDGTIISAVSADGVIVTTVYDPYDYAFVMFALAAAARRGGNRADLHARAQTVRDRLIETWKHPVIGFTEAPPLKSNPHMHLLEAFMAWVEVAGDMDPKWQTLADEVVELASDYFLDPKTGALTENFTADWLPAADARGLLVEPGHQFEWAWLLMRWAVIKGNSETFAMAWRLVEIGENNGVNAHMVAVNALNERLEVREPDAKLWPQAERVKALHAMSLHPMASAEQKAFAASKIDRAVAALLAYLRIEPTGLWHEVMFADGTFDGQPTKASSLYHITCAVAALCSAGDAAPKETA